MKLFAETQQHRSANLGPQLALPAPNEPTTISGSTSTQRRSRLGVRRFIKNQIHMFIYIVMHGIFSLYLRIRQFWNVVCYQTSSVLYYHHGTPQYIQKDVMGLERKPKHLSAVLKVEGHHKAKADLERLIDQTAELATWCTCADIPMLSVYEKTGKCPVHRKENQLSDSQQESSKSTCLEFTKL